MVADVWCPWWKIPDSGDSIVPFLDPTDVGDLQLAE